MLGEHADMLNKDRKEAPANHVPAAAVIREGRTLFGVTGLKGCVGGSVSKV